ncbi:MAG: HAMP domain-containing sensor histidine kinase [Bacteroidota bacterium]|nr:HAMP domain-containing sensor histidine kinase [Bacteroidota bacterium]MDP4216687.1 HAMP domain-containing sensor histidine kinase [Bacteroidota bacterium]MDP4244209.1 HAMP domain-containing sensor histidine kinase [Bacteroidota bacterium]MDP4253418.1 HAMP domain-containing sensor histidine kinase [Bacteroidota bacterium]MDP4258869.1 HAMP domain-containing sensor histidine kinase [Bacteroidota bacterium]
MIRSMLNWRSLFALLAIIIVSGTVFYSQYLAKKIAAEERQKVEEWVAASKAIVNGMDLTLPNLIRNGQQSIPIIETNERDSITGFINLDSAKVAADKDYPQHELKRFRSENQPLEIRLSDKPYTANRYYYGHTTLLDEVRYYPLVQLFIVASFIFFTLYSITIRNKATQNQLWAGMAKETAHQLGTPVSSLEGWVEMLKEIDTEPKIVQEIQKDVDRLKLISDRFGKIGSKPQLEERDLIRQVRNMVDYMRKRATGKVQMSLQVQTEERIPVLISGPLFDWVIENLLKNALDAMEGKGSIVVSIREVDKEVIVDITDTGKGIAKKNLEKVFKPGFTTKKRGWGLGLSLSKRIIEQYHKGELFVKQSEIGKGTTFRIVLNK